MKIMRHTVRKQQRKILKFADIVVFQHHHRQVRPDLIPAGKRACVCPVIGTAGIVEAMRIAADNGSVNEIVSGIQKILRNRTLRRRKRGGSFIRDQGHLYIVIQPACRAGAVQEGTKV